MYNVRVIKYPTGYQVKVYDCILGDNHERVNPYTGEVIERKKPKPLEPDVWYRADFDFEDLEWMNEEKRAESARISFGRTKNMIYYLARSNEWEWFVTLTFAPDKIDRYDFDVCSKRVREWFNNLKKRKAPGLYYLIVPEHHKDGAWHFHGLLGGCDGLTFKDSGVKDKDGEVIYNLENYKLGWTTAEKIKDSARASSYICKYITKDLCDLTKGKRRYFCSLGLQRAEVVEAVVPMSRMKEFREGLFDHLIWKKKAFGEFFDVEYFEVDKDWSVE